MMKQKNIYMKDVIKQVWLKYPKRNILSIQRYLKIYFKLDIDKISLNRRKND